MGSCAFYWSSTEGDVTWSSTEGDVTWSSPGGDTANAWLRYPGNSLAGVRRIDNYKCYGLSVRCVLDE